MARTAERLSRAEQNAANRRRILDAALEVFLAEGYHGTTVDAIAAAAGLTIGAIYSRFEGKADLFLTLAEERIERRKEQFRDLAPPTDGRAPVDVARRAAEVLRRELTWTLLVTEFRVHAARHAELAERYAPLHQRALDGLAENVAASAGLPPGEVPAAVHDLARVALAMGTGAAVARATEGEAFTDELYQQVTFALSDHFLGEYTR
jgi:AcrR family transcriptional regulator